MPTLAATLKQEIRRITARELKRALKPLKRLTRQLRTVKALGRGQKRTLARLERRMQKLGTNAGTLRRRRTADSGPRVSPAAIRTLRRRMKMTRLEFAKAVAVSPGSIFGWETGRSVPRGPSRTRLMQLKDKASSGRRAKTTRRRRPAGRKKS